MIRARVRTIDRDRQSRCPACSLFLPCFRGADEIVCACGAVWEFDR